MCKQNLVSCRFPGLLSQRVCTSIWHYWLLSLKNYVADVIEIGRAVERPENPGRGSSRGVDSLLNPEGLAVV